MRPFIRYLLIGFQEPPPFLRCPRVRQSISDETLDHGPATVGHRRVDELSPLRYRTGLRHPETKVMRPVRRNKANLGREKCLLSRRVIRGGRGLAAKRPTNAIYHTFVEKHVLKTLELART